MKFPTSFPINSAFEFLSENGIQSGRVKLPPLNQPYSSSSRPRAGCLPFNLAHAHTKATEIHLLASSLAGQTTTTRLAFHYTLCNAPPARLNLVSREPQGGREGHGGRGSPCCRSVRDLGSCACARQSWDRWDEGMIKRLQQSSSLGLACLDIFQPSFLRQRARQNGGRALRRGRESLSFMEMASLKERDALLLLSAGWNIRSIRVDDLSGK